MTAFAHQDKWILSQERLESESCSFVYSPRGSSYMATSYGAHEQPVSVALSGSKLRHPCRFAPPNDHVLVAARLGFTGAARQRH